MIQKSLPPTHLVTPTERPTADVVIYDGHCRFCTSQIRRLAGWDKQQKLAFVSLHDPFVAEHYPDLSHDEMMKQMYIVDQRGNRYGGAAALRYLSRRLPRLWPLALALHIPFSLPIWGWLYKQVAKRRYKLAGKTCDDGACDIHFK